MASTTDLRIDLGNIDFNKHNITFVNGVTLDRIKMKYNWLLNAQVKDAIIGEDSYGLIWYFGDWECGTWYDGTWYSGTFNGTWKNGKWYSYVLNKFDILNDKFTLIEDNDTASTFIDGVWESGQWNGGTFGIYQGLFEQTTTYTSGLTSGTSNQCIYINDSINYKVFDYSTTAFTYTPISRPIWMSGIFKRGYFNSAIWMNGVYNNETGYMMDSIWLNGTFAAGKFVGYEWYDGIFLSGDFDLGIWHSGEFNEMKKQKSIVLQNTNVKSISPSLTSVNSNVESRFGTAIFPNTFYFDGYGYIKTLWKGGTFKKGQFHSKLNFNVTLQPSLEHNLSIWENGVFENGFWYGGHFMAGTWMNGYWYAGIFGTTNGYNSNWNNGTWYSGLLQYSNFYNGTWYAGYMNASNVYNINIIS
jgi:hypothetical protein